MQITFYVLTTQKDSSDEESFLAFVCKLIQTVSAKSEQRLLVLDDDYNRLVQLDERLWTVNPSSFIPHDLCMSAEVLQKLESASSITHNVDMSQSNAPIVLTDNLLVNNLQTNNRLKDEQTKMADCIVLNLAKDPIAVVHDTKASQKTDIQEIELQDTSIQDTNIQKADNTDKTNPNPPSNPSRLLEIIPADEANKQHGRNKYRHYQRLGYQIEVHQIN